MTIKVAFLFKKKDTRTLTWNTNKWTVMDPKKRKEDED
jgi:hypothetical protein